MLTNLISSATGTVVAEIATLPICTAKTQYQNTHSPSLWNTMKSMYISGGISSFYRASLPAITSQTFSTCSKFVMYKWLRESKFQLSEWTSINRVAHGLIAGVTASFCTHPIDAVKVHWQMGKAFAPVVRQNGFKVLYRGYSKTFGKILLSSTLVFPLYETFMDQTHSPLLASASSAAISTCAMQPFDYLKTRQLYGNDLKEKSESIRARMSWYRHNVLTCYKGLHINLLRIVPHFAITMCVQEYIKEIIERQ